MAEFGPSGKTTRASVRISEAARWQAGEQLLKFHYARATRRAHNSLIARKGDKEVGARTLRARSNAGTGEFLRVDGITSLLSYLRRAWLPNRVKRARRSVQIPFCL